MGEYPPRPPRTALRQRKNEAFSPNGLVRDHQLPAAAVPCKTSPFASFSGRKEKEGPARPEHVPIYEIVLVHFDATISLFNTTKEPNILNYPRCWLSFIWRRARDSNPRMSVDSLHDFQSCSFDQLGQLSKDKHRSVISGALLLYRTGVKKSRGKSNIF